MSSSILTSVFGNAETEYTVKKSRFIASLREVRSEDEANAFIEAIKKKYWDARHHCYAYQIGTTGLVQKSSDAGEPSGTAGRPMLEVLKKSGITNTVVVVTRYFGGIKLGANGLIRAYSHAVSLGLEAARIADYKPHVEASARFDYTFLNTIERLLGTYQVITKDRDFSEAVQLQLQIPEESFDRFEKELANITNGSALLERKAIITLPSLRPVHGK